MLGVLVRKGCTIGRMALGMVDLVYAFVEEQVIDIFLVEEVRDGIGILVVGEERSIAEHQFRNQSRNYCLKEEMPFALAP